MRKLLVGLHDPRFHDSILRYYPDAKIVFAGPQTATGLLPKYVTVCSNNETHVTHIGVRSTVEFEVNEQTGWFIAAVYDLDTGERVDGVQH